MTTIFARKKSLAGFTARHMNGSDHPLAAMIEVADRCNEVCVHCYQIQGQKGEMTTEEVFDVLAQLEAAGVLFLTISGGEATLRSDFLDIVAEARARKFAVKIYTNALTMTEELARSLHEMAVQEVHISLYSHRPEVHDWVTGVPRAFERTVAGIQHLTKASVPVVIKSPLMRFNVRDREAYIAFAEALGVDFMFDVHLDPREDGERGTTAFELDDGEYVEARRALVGDSPPRDLAPLESSVCGACAVSVHIEANGEIRPCSQLQVPLGNVLTDGIDTTSASDEATFIRELTWADLHGCRICDLRRHCKRCFANAQMEGGDALGPYSSACRGARLSYEADLGHRPEIRPSASRRNIDIGPYRRVDDGVFEPIPDDRGDADDAIAAEHPWIRSPGGAVAAPSPFAAEPGGLVQIRRPGRSRPRQERVPDAEDAAAIPSGPGGAES